MLIVLSTATVGATLDAGSTGLLPEVEFPDAEGEGLAHFADDDGIDGAEEDEGRLALGDEAPDESAAMIGGPLRRDADDGAFDLDRRASAASRASDRRGGSGFGELIKAILGAVMGLAIGYYILLWLGRDPAQLKPFLHDYLPDWLVP
jgi:hypothetical protein